MFIYVSASFTSWSCCSCCFLIKICVITASVFGQEDIFCCPRPLFSNPPDGDGWCHQNTQNKNTWRKEKKWCGDEQRREDVWTFFATFWTSISIIQFPQASSDKPSCVPFCLFHPTVTFIINRQTPAFVRENDQQSFRTKIIQNVTENFHGVWPHSLLPHEPGDEKFPAVFNEHSEFLKVTNDSMKDWMKDVRWPPLRWPSPRLAPSKTFGRRAACYYRDAAFNLACTSPCVRGRLRGTLVHIAAHKPTRNPLGPG